MSKTITTTPSTTTTTPTTNKITPPFERTYQLLPAFAATPILFRGKQKQETFNALQSLTKPSTPAQVAKATKNLVTKFKIEESVSYHLHHLVKDGYATVTNPTINIALDPTI